MPIAQGRNGTIEISEQTAIQRHVILNKNEASQVNNSLGNSDSNITTTLFSNSPSISTNRSTDANDRGGLYTDANNSVYTAFSTVVDPSNDGVSGYGFTATSDYTKAYMNYRHPDNPFIVNNVYQLTLLTNSDAIEKDGKISYYRGYPKLQNNDINSPENDKESTPIVLKKNDNYGNTDSEYRTAAGVDLDLSADGLQNSYDQDILGKYFTKSI